MLMFETVMCWLEDKKLSCNKIDLIKENRVPFISSVLPKQGIGAELGVFKGQFSPLLMRYSDPKELHLIDPWYFLTGQWHWGGGNRSTVDAVIRILKLWKSEIEKKRLFVHIGDNWQTDPSHKHHGVFKAVNEFVEINGYSLVYASESAKQLAIAKSLHKAYN
jgi:hypothetical protein